MERSGGVEAPSSGAMLFPPRSDYLCSRPRRARFENDADSFEATLDYFRCSAIQSLVTSACLVSVEDLGWGALATWRSVGESVFDEAERSSGRVLYSLYVYRSSRGQRHFPDWLAGNPDKTIVTLPRCEIEALLRRLGHPHLVQEPCMLHWPEYRLIQHAYADHCAQRTGLHLMNHIDEGLFVLQRIGASEWAMRAFALHPLLQADEELGLFLEHFLRHAKDEEHLVAQVDPRALALAIEYRSVANGYLSQHPQGPIRLSPLRDVNDMLIADKVQNRKDFELFHSEHHDRRARLDEYFKEWLAALGVSEERYQRLKLEILGRVYGAGGSLSAEEVVDAAGKDVERLSKCLAAD